MYRLVISDDAGKTTVVMLVRDEITIGRAEENHICLTERNVSRRHARVVRHEGGFAIEDLGSYNGVKVNGIRIEGAVQLTPGDRVTLGDYQLRYESEATASLSGELDDVAIETQLPARLVMLSAPAPGAEFALARLPVRLGRSEDIPITVNHRSISREHAEFREVDGSVVIKDLASANGVRVNGEDVEEATLQDGDVLEFGQVRFRFVGQGVEFAFDPNAPEAIESEGESPSARAPSVVAVLILAVAVAVAAAIAVKGARDRDVGPAAAPVASAPAADPATQLAEAVRGCEDAVRSGRYEDALRSAERAVGLDANSSAAHDCRARANAGANAGSIVGSAIQLFRGGDVVRAYRELEQIPGGHQALTRAEVQDVARAYVDLKSTEANAALRSSNGSAAALAATEAAAAVDAFALDDLRPTTTELLDRARGASGGPAPQAAPQAQAAQAAQAGDLTAAQECLRNGDMECVIAATEGQDTLQALDLRFRALSRSRGRRADALRVARTLNQRFPNSAAGARARAYLEPAATP